VDGSLWQRLKSWLLLALGLGVLSFALIAHRGARRRHVDGLSLAERVYADLVDWVQRLLGIAPLSHQTPHEYAKAVGWAVPRGERAIERIAELYVQERFGGKEVPDEEVEGAWHEAWPNLWRRWAEGKTRRLRRIWNRFAARGE
jgi:hypothetical protein